MNASTLTARRPDFGAMDIDDLAWAPHAPEFAIAANAVSMQMPHVEPLFARIVRRHLDDLPEELAVDARTYCQQEIAHHQAHHRLDALLIERYPVLARIDSWAGRSYRAIENRCSAALQLGIAAGGESLAYSGARWVSQHHSKFVPDPTYAAAPVYLWHLAEEVEHKSVAYDVWRAQSGSRRHLALGMVCISLLLVWFTALGLIAMMWADRRKLGLLSGARVVVWAVSLGMEVLPNMAAALSRSHSPRDFVDPPWLGQWMQSFLASSADAAAGSDAAREPFPTATTVETCPSPDSAARSDVCMDTSSTPPGSMGGTTAPSTPDPPPLAHSGPSANDR